MNDNNKNDRVFSWVAAEKKGVERRMSDDDDHVFIYGAVILAFIAVIISIIFFT